jgi:hypothetical protein
MAPQDIFRFCLIFGFIPWAFCAAYFFWPRLKQLDRRAALRPILCLHAFRYLGLAFLVPGVVSPELSRAFAAPAAYGDLLAAVLAVISLLTLRTKFALPAVWLFNIAGTGDLLLDYYHGVTLNLPDMAGQLGAAFFIPVFYVPVLLITHAIAFRLLLDARFDQGMATGAAPAHPSYVR